MCRSVLWRTVGIGAACFGAGVLAAFILPGYLLAFIESVVVVTAGILLLGKR